MRAVVWNREYDDDYDDLSSMAPDARHLREPLPEPPLPDCSNWRSAARPGSIARKIWTAELCFASTVVSLVLLVVLAANNPSPYRIDYAAGCVFLAAASISFGYWGVKHWSEGTVANQEIRWLAMDVGVEGSYPVRIRVYQNHALTGIDDGVVYFRNDAIHFHGLRCDFVVGAQDLRFNPHMTHTPHGFEERGFIRPMLSLRHPEKEIDLWLEPYSKLSKHDHRDCNYRFRRDFRLFLHNWRASFEKSVYPPLDRELAHKSASADVVIAR